MSGKELRGARACRTLGRDVCALSEMHARRVIDDGEYRDLLMRLRRELEGLNARGMMTPHQYAKVLVELESDLNGVSASI